MICLYGILIFLAFNKHSKSGYFNYHSEIWSDKAGYYIYLPATLKYNLNGNNLPDSIVERTGKGFFLSEDKVKIETKYTYGVALLQLPFYLAADIVASTIGMQANGFSPIYHWAINLAAATYLFLGLFFLFQFLKSRFSFKTSLITVTILLVGTNLYYYGIDETGMSHVYSFFLFCSFLYLANTLKNQVVIQLKHFFLLGLIAGIILMVRPINILFLSSLLFLNLNTDNRNHLKEILNWKSILSITIGIVIILLPQMLYWNYLSGSFFYYSYGDESFNWSHPEIIKTLFAAKNSLFIYTPIFIIILFSLFRTSLKKDSNSIYLLLLFLSLTYVLSCWWDWAFGCALGGRNYVEYFSLFSIPLAIAIERNNNTKKVNFYLFYAFIACCIFYNLKLSYAYDGCFYGSNDWDWTYLKEKLLSIL